MEVPKSSEVFPVWLAAAAQVPAASGRTVAIPLALICRHARHLPNLLTLLRLLLTLPIAWLLLSERFAAALWLFAVAGASDALDGFLARRFGWVSRVGSVLDPLADKLLLTNKK